MRWALGIAVLASLIGGADLQAQTRTAIQGSWKRHVVFEGEHCNTAVAGRGSGGQPFIICNSGRKTRLFSGPQWKEVVLEDNEDASLIHSELLDVDRDGDLDFIGARYRPGLIYWLEQPEHPTTQPWVRHGVDTEVIGIHGLLVGDIDKDGHDDLLANSAQPIGPFKNSLVWYRVPASPRGVDQWPRHVLAQGDAPGLSHYLGRGDVNGDGRPDVASAAKGGPMDASGEGNWFAWWEAPRDPTQPAWKKHLIAGNQPGATNIHPADVNGDGKTDFIASRGHGKGVTWFAAPDWKEHPMDPELAGPHCLVVADLDGDGDTDAATCAKDDKRAVWFENDGKGNFRSWTIGTDQAAYDIRAVDLDGDRDLDLLVAGQMSKNVVWYENPLRAP